MGDVSSEMSPYFYVRQRIPHRKTNEYHAGILAKLEQKCVYLKVLKNTKSN